MDINFSLSRIPRIEFGRGRLARLPSILSGYGKRVLLVTGDRSFSQTSHWQSLQAVLHEQGFLLEHCRISGEPSPALIDEIVGFHDAGTFDVVLGIGGGSVLDAAKAIAGLMQIKTSVMDYLEGVGPELPYRGPAVPFIAVPTTAGTGSEATKNAVLSVQGKAGFKKSFRHESLVPQYAIIDPDLLASCPRELVAANGMDALTQLIESYVSSKASPMTDALALSGLKAVSGSLIQWYEQGAAALQAHEKMAYGALVSGITLAQVGLGSVHGLASPLGAFFPIPHGVVCGTLVACASHMNIQAMKQREPQNIAIKKYADVGKLLKNKENMGDGEACEALVETLADWTQHMELPRLSQYGVSEDDFALIVANSRGSSMKTNPILLTDEEIATILSQRT